jgi:hypothetical protein
VIDLDDENAECSPGYERTLWQEWVIRVCSRDGIPPPDASEWAQLSQSWEPGMAPLTSVAELQWMRRK